MCFSMRRGCMYALSVHLLSSVTSLYKTIGLNLLCVTFLISRFLWTPLEDCCTSLSVSLWILLSDQFVSFIGPRVYILFQLFSPVFMFQLFWGHSSASVTSLSLDHWYINCSFLIFFVPYWGRLITLPVSLMASNSLNSVVPFFTL